MRKGDKEMVKKKRYVAKVIVVDLEEPCDFSTLIPQLELGPAFESLEEAEKFLNWSKEVVNHLFFEALSRFVKEGMVGKEKERGQDNG